MNMMGKRVNYAARSVISPDPYIGAGEAPSADSSARQRQTPSTHMHVHRRKASCARLRLQAPALCAPCAGWWRCLRGCWWSSDLCSQAACMLA